MYLDFYGITEKPFTLSPNPRYLYYSRKHKEALSQIIYAVTEHYGYMVLTGDVGTGKTTLINALLQCLPGDFEVAKIFHTVLSPKGLIQNICKEFKISFENYTMAELIFKLHSHLTQNHKNGRKSLLILDEAQNLSENILEEIRLLSNFEANDEKFIQILLVGQPELEDKLSRHSLRQLRDRINLKYDLSRLQAEDTAAYIAHRLRISGYPDNGSVFTKKALEQIQAVSEGIPRKINIACDNAMLLGYAKNVKPIDDRIVAESCVQHQPRHSNGSARSETHTIARTVGEISVTGASQPSAQTGQQPKNLDDVLRRILAEHKLFVAQPFSWLGWCALFLLLAFVVTGAVILALWLASKFNILT